MQTGTWSVRHEGSPRAVDGLTVAQVIVGLRDGLWEPTDEVLGPGERQWVAIEAHSQLQAVAAEVEPPVLAARPDETRLDMTPLIDVCLVLLIFVILTEQVVAKRNYLPLKWAQAAQNENPNAARKVTLTQVKENMIRVTVDKAPATGEPRVVVEDHKPVGLDQFRTVLQEEVDRTKKHEMLLDITGVSWGDAVRIQDDAKAAGVNQINLRTSGKK
jgi:biopolymer transport protein ExbD